MGEARSQEAEAAKFREEALERVKAEREKLKKHGNVGEKVRIVGRSVSPKGEVVGEIIAIETDRPFGDDFLQEWQDEGLEIKDLPCSIAKVYVTEGEDKGTVVTNLVASEWEPIS